MTRTIEIELPQEDLSFLRDLTQVRGWKAVIRRQKKSGIERGLDDLRNGRIYHAATPADLIKQCLG